MSAMSRRKGCRGELEAADRLRTVFPDAKRSYHQARSGSDAPDLEGTERLWVEVEVSAKPSPQRKMRQAVEAIGEVLGGPVPVVLTRQCSRSASGEWLVTMRLDDLIDWLPAIGGSEGL